jgi:type IV secretory pathway TraG/TraD family ATPase VirD4
MASSDPSVDERDLAVRWAWLTGLAALLLLAVGMILAYPVTDFFQPGSPAAWWERTLVFLRTLAERPEAVGRLYAAWWRSAGGQPPVSWLVASGASLAALAWGLARNPHSFARTSHGSARWATLRDLERDELLDETGIVLGRWRNGWKLIRNWETLSAILIAPPGTGKTVMLIANILADWPDRVRRYRLGFIPSWRRARVPAPCMVINDPKGEIYKKTAGWRSTLGTTIRLAWGNPAVSARWNPLSPRSYPGGERCVALRRDLEARLDAFWRHPGDVINQLLVLLRDGGQDWARQLAVDPGRVGALKPGAEAGAAAAAAGIAARLEELQVLMSEREKHVDRLAAILIPDTVEQHWRITGREFLAGAIGFIMARCEREGREPSFGLLLDWLQAASRDGSGFRDLRLSDSGERFDDGDGGGSTIRAAGAPDNVGTPEAPTGGDADDDKTARILDEALDEIRAYGYPERVYLDLNATRIKPDRERGSVISTGAGAIAIFKNAAVRAVTSTSSFSLKDCRGIEVDGQLRPVTYYVTISLEDAEFLGRVTGLFVETLAAFAISQDEDEFKTPWEQRGEIRGRPLQFILDEFWTMPALRSLTDIPALGRGQWVSMIVVGQSYGQIGAKYRSAGGNDVVDTIKAAVAYKTAPTQNDLKTAKEISDSIGNRTVTQKSVGREMGMLAGMFQQRGGRDPFSRNVNESTTGLPLIRADEIMSMEKLDPKKRKRGWQIVQMSGAMNRPIMCRPVAWFEHPRLKKRAGLPVRDWRRDPPAANDTAGPARGAARIAAAFGGEEAA